MPQSRVFLDLLLWPEAKTPNCESDLSHCSSETCSNK